MIAAWHSKVSTRQTQTSNYWRRSKLEEGVGGGGDVVRGPSLLLGSSHNNTKLVTSSRSSLFQLLLLLSSVCNISLNYNWRNEQEKVHSQQSITVGNPKRLFQLQSKVSLTKQVSEIKLLETFFYKISSIKETVYRSMRSSQSAKLY